MGTDSRATRSGQNSSGSGKRPTRSTAKTSADPKPVVSSTSTRAGSVHKHTASSTPAASALSRGTGTGRRAAAKRKLPRPSPQPAEDEILDEIVVSTNGLAELDVEMSEDEAEALGKAKTCSGPGSGTLGHASEIGHPGAAHRKGSPLQMPAKETVSSEYSVTKPADETVHPSATGPAKERTLSPLPKQPSPTNSEAHQSNVGAGTPKSPIKKETLGMAQVETGLEETVSTVPAAGNGVPPEPAPPASDNAVAKTEAVDEQLCQTDTHRVTPQVLSPPIPPHDTAIAGLADGQSQSVTFSTMVGAKTFEEKVTGPHIKDESTEVEEAIPKELEPEAPDTGRQTAVQATVEPEEVVEDPAPDEPSAFDDAMQAGLHLPEQAMSPGLGLGPDDLSYLSRHAVPADLDESKDADMTQADTSPQDRARELRLSPSDVHRLDPGRNASIPALESVPRDNQAGERAHRSPSEASVSIDLDGSVSSDETVDDPPSLLPRSESMSNSWALGPLSTQGAGQAFQNAKKASQKDGISADNSANSRSMSSGLSVPGAVNGRASHTNDLPGASPYASHSGHAPFNYQTSENPTLKQIIGVSRASLASSSSLSTVTDVSGLSSKPGSDSSKATTPFDADSPREAPGHFASGSAFQSRAAASRIQFNVRPRVSIPTDLTPQEYAMECIEAGENSRLNAYALHQDEYLMLRAHISHAQVSTYLNIRNGILRLWVRNPQIAVTREEAIGCAKDTRWFDVANVCFDWLVRRGFINYGCVEIRQSKAHANHSQMRQRKTVVVIGAGFSGLGCARQLEGLFLQYSKRFRDMGEEPPRIVVLEGRNRVGGRVYSRAFETVPATAPGVMRGRRFTAEMGGMIITGFERGNPLNILVRGQLGLPYHCLLADMSLHDSNGTNVDLQRDTLVEQLYNVCLERVSEYKFKTQPAKLIEGNRDLMDEGRDSTAEGHKTIASIEETAASQPHAPPVSEQNVAPRVDLVPVSTNRMTGKVHTEPGTAGSTKAAVQAKQIGWTLKAGVSDSKDIDLGSAINDPKSTLGSVLDNALMQHKEILDLNAQDFRLFNWHIANLEYSNATNLNRLSSRGWDVDVGNEWDGRHTMVVGGYQSVARGLATLPAPLKIQHNAAVKRISYSADSSAQATITLEDGKSIEADYVVNTIPLGVLKHGNVEFQPPLPSWKTQAIERLGFGVLNKVILVYKEAFWDKDRDIFGMLQTPTNRLSMNQKDYACRRGRFFQWFSVTNTTGMPCLLALMAGDAAYDTEVTPNDDLIAEATEILRTRYGARVTQPLEAIVTRWESDRFARGSYSNAGVNMQPEDYQLMARTIGNLYFAGEHTIVTHPATVHGAYLSGLRAASDVLDSMLGPIEIPNPLVMPRETAASLKRKAQQEHQDPTQARLEAYEMEISEHILATLGAYPLKPNKVAGNPYILYNKAYYDQGRKKCEEGRRAGKGKPSPNEVRTMTSKMWKEASPEVRKPFEDAAEAQKRGFALAMQAWGEAATKWERDAAGLREKFVKEHPSVPGPDELPEGDWNVRRAKRVVESYRETDSDIEMD